METKQTGEKKSQKNERQVETQPLPRRVHRHDVRGSLKELASRR